MSVTPSLAPPTQNRFERIVGEAVFGCTRPRQIGD